MSLLPLSPSLALHTSVSCYVSHVFISVMTGTSSPREYLYSCWTSPQTPFVGDPAWGSASAPPMGTRTGRPPMFPIDPSLDADDWGDMSRNRPDRFLRALVAALEAPNPISGGGPPIEEAFKGHLVSLAPNSKNSAPTIPSLYSILKTFWLPSSPVYFSLTASASTARTPSEHRFLYWDPQPLVFNGISCPVCSSPLLNRGRISSGPIKIYDLDKPFFVIGCEYACMSHMCLGTVGPQGRKFASTDASILRALPAKLKDEFPALLLQGTPDLGTSPEIWDWHGMGVSTALWNMVRASLRAGLRKEAILEIIRVIQHGTSDYDYTAYKHEEEEGGEQGGDDEEEEEETNDAQQVEDGLADKDVHVSGLPSLCIPQPTLFVAGVEVDRGVPGGMERQQWGAGHKWRAPTATALAAGASTGRPEQLAGARGDEWTPAERKRWSTTSTPTTTTPTSTTSPVLRVRAASTSPVPGIPRVSILEPGAGAAATSPSDAEADVLDRGGRTRAGDDGADAQADPALLQVRVERVQGQGRACVLQ